MTSFVTHRLSGLTKGRGRSMLRSGRLLANKLHVRCTLTPQERANLYVFADADCGSHGLARRAPVGQRGQPPLIRSVKRSPAGTDAVPAGERATFSSPTLIR